jgi:hypothetical protein
MDIDQFLAAQSRSQVLKYPTLSHKSRITAATA